MSLAIRSLRSFLLLPTLLALGGLCAAAVKAPPVAPSSEDPWLVQIMPNGHGVIDERPLGAYHVPDSDLVVTGHQRSLYPNSGAPVPPSVGMALVVETGRAARFDLANATAKASGVVDVEDTMHFTYTAELRDDIVQAVAEAEPLRQAFVLRGQPPGGRMTVAAGAVLSHVAGGKVQPCMVLRVQLYEKGQRRSFWEQTYFASTGGPRPMKGEGSWTADGSADLEADLSASLKAAVRVMLDDVAHPAPRTPDQVAVATLRLPFRALRVDALGFRLGESDGRAVFLVPGSEDVSGVHVVEKSLVQWRAPRADEPMFANVPEPAGAPMASGSSPDASPAATNAPAVAAAAAASAPKPEGGSTAP